MRNERASRTLRRDETYVTGIALAHAHVVGSDPEVTPTPREFAMHVTRTSLIGLAALSLTASIAHAQITEGIRFTTSFAFTAGRVELPAGTYLIAPMTNDPGVLAIEDAKGTRVILETDPAASEHPGRVESDKVVFTKTDDTYVLCQVWDEADRSGAQIVGTFKLTQAAAHALVGAGFTGRSHPPATGPVVVSKPSVATLISDDPSPLSS
jgi:hypothetical protein